MISLQLYRFCNQLNCVSRQAPREGLSIALRCWRVCLRGMMRCSLVINKFWRLLRGKSIPVFVKFPWEFIRLWIISCKSTLSFVYFSSLSIYLMGLGWPAVNPFQTTICICKHHPNSIKLNAHHPAIILTLLRQVSRTIYTSRKDHLW